MKTKKTNPLGKQTKNVGANVPQAVYDELARLAETLGVGISSCH